jgi:hypothetical protein
MKLSSFPLSLRTIKAQEVLDANISNFTSLNRALDAGPAFHDPDTLYESIVRYPPGLWTEKVSSCS